MVSTKKFSDFDSGGDLSNDNITVGYGGGDNTQYNNPWTFLPPGATGDRPVPSASMYYRLRLNTTLEVYEYYDPTTLTWAQLSGTGSGTVNPGVANDIAFYAANGQAVSPIAGANNSVLRTNGTGVPSLSNVLPAGLSIPGAAITGSTAALISGEVTAAPSAGNDLVNKTYADSLFGSGVTSLTGTTNQITFSSPTGSVTASLPQDIAVGSTPTFAGLTLSSIPLAKGSGGTGVNAAPTSASASNFAAWDTNVNLPANNYLGGFASNTSSGGTTVLTIASAMNQEITGVLTHTLQLPVSLEGLSFKAINNSSGTLTITSSGGNTILVMASNTTAFIIGVTNAGTVAASWNASYVFDNGAGVLSITGTANQVIASASTGAVVLSLPQDIAAASSPTFANLNLSNGGAVRTGTGAGNTALLQAYDVDGAAYVTFGTLTANNTPTFDLSASTTIAGNAIGVITPWVAYTPTFTGFGTVGTAQIFSRRVGGSLQIRGIFISGTSTAVEARMTLGFNGTDSNVTSSGSFIGSIQVAGSGTVSFPFAGCFQPLIEQSIGYITFGILAAGSSGLTKVTGNGFVNAGDTVSILCDIPITGW